MSSERQRAQRHPRDRGRQRIAAEGGAVRTELHDLGDLRASQHRADRHATTQRLGEGDDVRHHAVLPVREQRAAAAHPALDFVQHQQCIVLVAQRAHRLQEAGPGRHHPALALHRLEQHRGHVAGLAIAASSWAMSLKST